MEFYNKKIIREMKFFGIDNKYVNKFFLGKGL